MNISSNEKVNDFLSDIQSVSVDNYNTLVSIRNAFLNVKNDLEEDIKYGGIVFNIENTLIGGIFIYKQHISIEFSKGALFNDPDNILDGSGKMRRHIKIFSIDDITNKKAAYFIKQVFDF